MLSKLSYLISNFALTLGYLNPTLNNPTSHKATTIRTLTRRAQLVCDSPDSLQDETDYLNNVFSKNNYNTDFVRRNTHSNTYSNTQPNVHSGSVTKATIIPYIRSTFETIACILQPYNIRVAHKPITTIRRLLTNVKVCTARSTLPLDGAYSGDDEICSNRHRAVTSFKTESITKLINFKIQTL